MIQPETQFTNVGNDRVAYQVLGAGPRDLLLTWGFWSHLDIEMENPVVARYVQRLASFSRLIVHARRSPSGAWRRSRATSGACDDVIEAATTNAVYARR